MNIEFIDFDEVITDEDYPFVPELEGWVATGHRFWFCGTHYAEYSKAGQILHWESTEVAA